LRNTVIAIGAAVLAAVLAVVWWLSRSIGPPDSRGGRDPAAGAEQVAAASMQVLVQPDAGRGRRADTARFAEETSASLEEIHLRHDQAPMSTTPRSAKNLATTRPRTSSATTAKRVRVPGARGLDRGIQRQDVRLKAISSIV